MDEAPETDIPLDFDIPLSELPPSHDWPPSYIHNHPSSSASVPIIDLSKQNSKLLALIKNASERWGIFQIINHDVPNSLLRDLEMEIKELFSLPTEAKLRALHRGGLISGYGDIPISRFSPKMMWYEGFAVKGSPYEHAKKLWPPHGNVKFCQVIEGYQMAMKVTSGRILGLMLNSMGLSQDDIHWGGHAAQDSSLCPSSAHLQLNSYPACPDPTHAMGMTQHTDSSVITILNQVNDVGGLQVLHKGEWVTVQPDPKSLVVNVGDLGHIISNGRFLTPVHRVLTNKDSHRYSTAYFYGMPRGVRVAPLAKLVDPGRTPMYRSITWEEYLAAKSKFSSKALELVRLGMAGCD